MSHKRKFADLEAPAKRLCTEKDFHPRQPQQPKKSESIRPSLPSIDAQYESPVFTHQSAVAAANSSNDLKSYERLEFLGDAYIELMASKLIWNKFATLPTGRMSQVRELLVKNETLSQFSSLYGFDKKIRLGTGFIQDNPKTWTKVKGDVFEAYVAAIVLSDPANGIEVAEKWLAELWGPKLRDVEQTGPDMLGKVKLAAAIKAPGVKIDYVEERPPVPNQKGAATYFMGVYLTGWGWENQHLGSGKALNKNGAGNDAATKAMQNKPLIDQVIAKKKAFYAERDAAKETET